MSSPDDDPTPFDEDLEAAYRQALRAIEATDLPDGFDAADDDGERDVLPIDFGRERSPAAKRPAVSAAPSVAPASGSAEADAGPRVTPVQILEAALFVGGIELTAERLAALLKGDFTPEFVVRTLDDLGRRYAAEGRPYAVRREEGTYRLALRDEHEALRRRVYGLGPKEVKLSPEALEVLSLVAYRQPVSRTALEEKRPDAAGQLRQLVRRGLLEARRDGDAKTSDEPRYVTTARFLEVFGIARLEELPRAADLNLK